MNIIKISNRTLLILVLGTLFVLQTQKSFSQQYTADTLKKDLIANWNRLKDYTLEYIKVMPEDGINFKLTPNSRSFAENLLHAADADFFWISMGVNIKNPYPFQDSLEKTETLKVKGNLTKIVTEGFNYVINALNNLKAKELWEKQDVAEKKYFREGFFRVAFEHQVHMTAQCVMYLKVKGVKVPEETLY